MNLNCSRMLCTFCMHYVVNNLPHVVLIRLKFFWWHSVHTRKLINWINIASVYVLLPSNFASWTTRMYFIFINSRKVSIITDYLMKRGFQETSNVLLSSENLCGVVHLSMTCYSQCYTVTYLHVFAISVIGL